MDESDLRITDKTKDNFQILLSAEQLVLKDSLFCNNLFKTTCWKIQDRNEAIVI